MIYKGKRKFKSENEKSNKKLDRETL